MLDVTSILPFRYWLMLLLTAWTYKQGPDFFIFLKGNVDAVKSVEYSNLSKGTWSAKSKLFFSLLVVSLYILIMTNICILSKGNFEWVTWYKEKQDKVKYNGKIWWEFNCFWEKWNTSHKLNFLFLSDSEYNLCEICILDILLGLSEVIAEYTVNDSTISHSPKRLDYDILNFGSLIVVSWNFLPYFHNETTLEQCGKYRKWTKTE